MVKGLKKKLKKLRKKEKALTALRKTMSPEELCKTARISNRSGRTNPLSSIGGWKHVVVVYKYQDGKLSNILYDYHHVSFIDTVISNSEPKPTWSTLNLAAWIVDPYTREIQEEVFDNYGFKP